MKSFFLALALVSIAVFLASAFCGMAGPALCAPAADFAAYAGSAAIHAGLLSLALYFLWAGDLRSTLASVGFPGSIKDGLFYGAMTMGAMLLALMLFGIAAIALNFNDQHKVSEKIVALPPLILAFAILGAPFTEELFFRGYLAMRFGIIPSSVLFGLMHFAYGSVVEVAGAFIIGLVLASSMRLTKSVTPAILAHMAYNALSITIITLYS